LAGYGYWGANLARNIRSVDRLRLVGVVDAAAASRSAAAEALPGVTTWPSLAGALADDAVQAVVIALPAAQHAEAALSVLDAGRHVMVEKPLAATPADADRIVARGHEVGRIVMVGHTFLYSPPVLRIRELIASGELGDIQYLYSQRLSLGRIRRDVNALWNFAPHDVSIMLHLLDARPEQVSGTSMTMIDPAVPDVFFSTLRFPGGIGAHLHVSWIDPRKTRLMTIVGDEKMVIYNDVSVDQKIWIVDAGVARSQDMGTYESLGDFQWRTRAGDILIPKVEMTEPLKAEMEEFAAACLDGRAPRTDGEHGAAVVRVLDAIDRSAAAGGIPVELPS
jgi:predicted dehydrogenase